MLTAYASLPWLPVKAPSAASNVAGGIVLDSSNTYMMWSACAPSISAGLSETTPNAAPVLSLSVSCKSSFCVNGCRPTLSHSTMRDHLWISGHRNFSTWRQAEAVVTTFQSLPSCTSANHRISQAARAVLPRPCGPRTQTRFFGMTCPMISAW